MTAKVSEIHVDDWDDLPAGFDWRRTLPMIAARRVAAMEKLIACRRIAGSDVGAATITVAVTLIAYIAETRGTEPGEALEQMRDLAIAAGWASGADLDHALAQAIAEPAYINARDAGRASDLRVEEWRGFGLRYIYPAVGDTALAALLKERKAEGQAAKNASRATKSREVYLATSATALAKEHGISRKTLYARMKRAGCTTIEAYRAHLGNRSGSYNNYIASTPVTPVKTWRFDVPSALSDERRRATVAHLLATISGSLSPARSAPPSKGAR